MTSKGSFGRGEDPDRQTIPLDVYKAFQEYGIVYSCSINLYYDLHIGLWRLSPNYKKLQNAFLSYCAQNGYVLPYGLIISNGSQEYIFLSDPNINK